MADKNFKVKNGLSIQGTTSDTLITADNSGGILIGGSPLGNSYQIGDTASRPASPSLGQIYSNTQTGYIEVYTSAGWSELGVVFRDEICWQFHCLSCPLENRWVLHLPFRAVLRT